jgi:hypothetical protein
VVDATVIGAVPVDSADAIGWLVWNTLAAVKYCSTDPPVFSMNNALSEAVSFLFFLESVCRT